MKKSIVVVVVGVVVVLIGGIVYSYMQASEPEKEIIEVESGPHIVIDPATHDFGRVKFGDVPEYTFAVKNSGDQILEIKSVTTSCACTKGEMEEMSIAPGGTANLVVSFDPAVHGDDTDMGELTRTIYLSTNDSNQEEVEAKIYAEVYK